MTAGLTFMGALDRLRWGLFSLLWQYKGHPRRLATWWNPSFLVATKDLHLRLFPAHNLTERRTLERGWFPEAQSLDKVLSVLDGCGTLVDIGANCGAYSLPAAVSGAAVVAVEPSPIMASRLRENAQLNALSFAIHEAALASHEEGVVLNISKRNFGTSSVRENNRRLLRSVKVPSVTLVNLLPPSSQRPIVVKADIEGYEDEALCPFFEYAKPHDLPDAVLLETDHASEWSRDLLGTIKTAGYKSVFSGEGNTLFVREEPHMNARSSPGRPVA